MKKIIPIIVGIVSAVVAAVVIISVLPTKHTHNFGEWHEEVNATCETTGTKGYYECECGLRFDRNYNELMDVVIPKIEHHYEKENVKSTCEKEGYTLYTCIYCNHQYKADYIPCLEHEYIETVISPTCEERGYTIHTCNRCDDTYKDNYTDPTGHDYGVVAYVWSEDYSALTATRVCYNDKNHIETETVSTTFSVVTASTCTTKGVGRYISSSFRNKAFEVQKQDVTLESLGHKYGEVTYEWAEDYTSVTATRVCGNDENHVETETVFATYSVMVQPTCTGTGLGRHTSTNFKNNAFSVQTYDVLLEAQGHNLTEYEYKAPTCLEVGYEAYEKCSKCDYTTYVEIPTPGHKYEETATFPTCTEQGYTTHTCSVCGDSYVDTYVNALDHKYGEVTYEWAEDYTSVTATRVCGNDENHVETETVFATYSVVVQPTCTGTGLGRHTSTNFKNSAFSAQTYDVLLEALGHNLTEYEYKAPTCLEVGYEAYEKCSKCDYTTYVEIPAPGHKYEETVTSPTCTEQGYTTHTCSVCGDSYVDTYVNALGHKYGEVTYEWAEDYTSVTATRVCGNDENDVETETVFATYSVVIEPTCTGTGSGKYTSNSFTNNSFLIQTFDVELEALGHKIVIDEAVEPTLGETGLTEGSHCEVCGEIFIEQEEIPMLVLLTLTSNNNSFGTVSENQILAIGEEVTVVATPNEDCYFFGWFNGDKLISDNLTYTFNMLDSNYELEAKFTKNKNSFANVWDGTIATSFSGGSGRSSDPYIIETAAQLAYMAKRINSGLDYSSSYKLMNNIDLNSINWIPIGSNLYPFTGIFEGNGHIISNLTINSLSSSHRGYGLFGYVQDATIRKIGIENVDINVVIDVSQNIYIGGIVGQISSSYSHYIVENAYTTGTITADFVTNETYTIYVGGVAGYSYGISNCYSACDITVKRYVNGSGYAYAGGISGYARSYNNSSVSIYKSIAMGDVSCENTYSTSYAVYTGGLIGYGNQSDSYRYEGQKIFNSYSLEDTTYNKLSGLSCSIDNLNDISFYQSKLYWSSDVWNFEELNFENGRYPTLIQEKDYKEIILATDGNGSTNFEELIIKKNCLVNIIAVPNSGYEFVGWYSGEELISEEENYTFIANEDKNYTAKFKEIDYILEVSSNKEEINLEYDSLIYNYEDEIALEAIDVEGYYFEGWYINDELVCSDLIYNFDMPANDVEIKAVYRQIFELTVVSNDDEFGTTTQGKEAYETELISLTATPNEGYKFFGWIEGNKLLSESETYDFKMLSKDCKVEAWFVEESFDDEAIKAVDVWDGNVATSFAGGDGTEDNPYIISTGAELAYLRNLINSSSYSNYYTKYYKLVNDIDLNNLSWTPIGNISSSSYEFRGHFDGNGHVIYNLSITISSSHLGLFGYVYNGYVENLGIDNINISKDFYYSNTLYVGGLIGYGENVQLQNCYTIGSIDVYNNDSSSYKLYVGGLVGYMSSASSNINSCYSTCDVTGKRYTSNSSSIYAGGLVGRNYGTIINSFATGDVKARNTYSSSYTVYAGGLVGSNSGTITNSYRYEGQTVTSTSSSGVVTAGTTCSIEELNSKEFYIDNLGWSEDIFNIDDVAYENASMPTFYKKYYQVFVTFEGNGIINQDHYISSNNRILLQATPDDGHELVGWYVEDQLLSEETEYIYIISDTKTITAVFDYIEYVINVESGNGVTITGEQDSYHYEDEVDLVASVVEGYTFVGWYENDILITNEMEYSFVVGLENRSLEARSIGTEYTIEYDEKVGARIIFNSMGGSEVDPITTSDFDYPIPTYPGYLFTGWYSDIALTERYEFTGEIIEEVVLYAGWTRYSSTGVINIGDSLLNVTVPDRNSSKQYYAFVPLVSQTITIYSLSSYDTYGFLYDGSKNQLTANDDDGENNNFSITYTVEAGKLYYIAPAGYSGSVTLSLYISGQRLPEVSVDTIYLDQQKVNYGEEFTLLFKERKGYDFVGYFTGENGTGTQLTDSNGNSLTPYNILGDTIVYNHYVPSSYDITLDYADGITESGIIEVTYLEEYELPIPSREMFIFDGWYYNDNLIDSTTWIIFDGDITLTAKWLPISVENIEFVYGTEVDVEDGVLEIEATVNPTDAYYSYITYEITHGAEETGAVLVEENEKTYLNATVSGEIMILVSVYNEYDEIVYTESVVFYIYTTEVASVEIVNENNIINVGEEVQVELEYYPSTAEPKEEVIYQLMTPNTCGATITADGIITVTQPGSVRVRAKVDDSDWSSSFTFYVPNTISTPEEFYAIRDNLSGYYTVINDIDLSGYDSWEPIGYAENSDLGLSYTNAFKGYINGNGHKITGLKIDVSQTDYLTVGLFGALDNTARIIDLSIENYEIIGDCAQSIVYIGAFAGIVNGKVSGCNVSGELDILGAEYIGGAVGQLFGEFKDSTVNTKLIIGGKVDTILKVGGTIGYFPQGVLEKLNVSTQIDIHASYGYYVGSVVGNSEGNINDSIVESADIIAYATEEDSYAGLLVGKSIYQETNNVEINGTLEVASAGTLYVGGIAGYAIDVKNSSYTGEITVTNVENIYYGNIVGYAAGDIINTTSERSLVQFTANGDVYYGGIAGYVGGNVSDTNFVDLGINIETKGKLYVGGISGYVGGNIEEVSYQSSNLYFESNQNLYAGGIAGYVGGNTLDADVIFDDLYIANASTLYVGGVAGFVSEAFSSANISYTNMEIQKSISAYIGGGVGYLENKAEGITHTAENIDIYVCNNLYYGGVVGYGKGINDVNNTIKSINITGDSLYVGGIAGASEDLITIEESIEEVIIKNANTVYYGNLAGITTGTVDNTNVTNTIVDILSSYNVYYGGLVANLTGDVSDSTVVSNINVISTGLLYAGATVGKSSGDITSINVSGDIISTSESAYVGGIAGKNDGCISDVEYIGTLDIVVDKQVYIGGIVGDGNEVVDSKSYSEMNIVQKIASTLSVGGITGHGIGEITNGYYFGFISVTSEGYINETDVYEVYVGGLVGQTTASVIDSKSNAVIDVENKYNKTLYTGGIAGLSTASVENSKADGTVTISNEYNAYIGGLVGYSANVANSFSIGSIKTTISGDHTLYLGGVAGYNNGSIEESYYSFGDLYGASEGKLYSGGISGYANADISNCYSSYSYIVTDMSKVGNEAYLGGIVGYNNATISYSYSMNYIDGKADGTTRTLYIGGIAGYNTSSVTTCYTLSASEEGIRSLEVADIDTTSINSANVYAGGLVGYNGSSATIANTYTCNKLLTRNSVTGGLVGVNEGSVINSISRALIEVVFGEKVGVFAGYTINAGTYTDCFYSTANLESNATAVGTGNSEGISGKTSAQLKGTMLYINYDKTIWLIVNGKYPELIFDEEIWGESTYYLYLNNVINAENQHQYPIPEAYCLITFDVGLGEYPIDPIYVHEGEGIFLVAEAKRIGYTFKGWYFDEEFTQPASDRALTFTADCTLYAKWEANIYDLTVEVDGEGTTNITQQSYIYLDEITLTTDDVELDYIFVGWFDGDTLLSTDKTYTFDALPRDQIITAKYLSYYELLVVASPSEYGTVTTNQSNDLGLETKEYTVIAEEIEGYTFFGWFDGDTLLSTELEYTFIMPSKDYKVEARFTAQTNESINVWDGTAATSFAGGDGTEDNPYIISTGAELAYLRNLINSNSYSNYYTKYYKLVNDIDLNNISWTPIGNKSSSSYEFRGHFDGNGHVIYNLSITSTNSYYIGLFGYAYNSEITNLGIENIKINMPSSYSNNIYVGGLIGYGIQVQLQNCYTTGSIYAYNGNSSSYIIYVGGLVGYMSSGSNINSGYSTCVVEGKRYVSYGYRLYAGGLVGSNDGTIINSFATGDVKASNTYSSSYTVCAGGLVGSNSGTITNSYRYDGQTVTSTYSSGVVTYGTTCSIEELNSKEFYVDTLGWSDEIWVLENYNFEQSITPRYSSYYTYYQTFVEIEGGGETNYNDVILAKGNTVILSSLCGVGYYFVGWFDGEELLSDESSIVYKPSSSRTIIAKFENIDYVVNAVSNKEDISVRGSKSDYHFEDTVNLIARTVQGYYFEGWYLDGEKVSNNLTYSFKMPANDLEVIAVYREYFELTSSTNNQDFGSVTSGKTAYETENVKLTATPNEGYNFFGWFNGDTLLSTELEYTFIMPSKDYEVEARFTAQSNKSINVWDGSIATSFAGGDGTEDNPYIISTGAELAYLRNLINSSSYSNYYTKYYKMVSDIDLNNLSWTPIGNRSNSSYEFRGYFDGNDCVIYNLSVTTSSTYLGLFGYVYGGCVQNLGIENVKINISTSSANNIYVGGLIGYGERVQLQNCYTNGRIRLSNSYNPSNSSYKLYVGGLAGYISSSSSNINSCYSICDVEGERYSSYDYCLYVGGLVGSNYGKIINSFATGDVKASNTKSSSYSVYAGGLIGSNSGTTTNSYRYEGQTVTSTYSSGVVTAGTTCSIEELNAKEFYVDTLGWSSDNWRVDNLDFENEQYPYLFNSRTYYQILVESDEYGTINLSEAIVRAGMTINLIATPIEGYEFVGWFDGDEFISEEKDFIYLPTKSININAKFDVVENTTLLVYADNGLVVEEHELRYLENSDITLSAVVEEGYRFINWTDEDSNEISTDLSITYTLGTTTAKLYLNAIAIDYTLTTSETYDSAGDLTTNLAENNIYNVHNEIKLNYVINPGYTFLGWYNGETLLSEDMEYVFNAPAKDLNIEAKTETIKYQLSVSSTTGGSVNTTGGSYSILDDITLIATPDKSYDFIGWYLNGEVYSYDKEIIYNMPLADCDLEVQFTLAYVEINVVSGFNGEAIGSTKQLKDTEITVTAIPNEGFMLEGWYLNGEVVSRDTTFTQVYNVSGTYTLYAEFIEQGLVISYHPNNGEDVWSEQVTSTSEYILPYLYREKYDFEGWYLDENYTTKLDITSLNGITDAYAKWSEKTNYSQLLTELTIPYTIELYSRKDIVVLSNEDTIMIYDSEGNSLETTIVYGAVKGYYIVSAEFAEGNNYHVEIIDDEVFATNGMRSFALSFTRDDIEKVAYSSEVIQFGMSGVIEIIDGYAGIVLDDETELIVEDTPVLLKDYDLFYGDLLYCYDGEDLVGYVDYFNITSDGNYEIYFTGDEVSLDAVFDTLSVADSDIEFDLENATIEGDETEAMAAFSEVAAEATSFNMLYSSLTTLAENDQTFSFGKPKFTPKFECKGTTINISVTITVEGKRLDSNGEEQDNFTIRVVVGLKNVISTSCDIDIDGLKVKKFEYSIKNVTTASFGLDVIYANEEQGKNDNFDALKLLLDEYKENLSETKDLPFDVNSRNENTFDDLKVRISIPIGTSGLAVDVTITPFVRYVIIGQLDIDTSISVINTCTLAYVNGNFNVYFNSETQKSVTVYALAYVNIEAGVNAAFDIYFQGLKSLISAGVDFEVGPYLTASGALIYENGEADFSGYVEWGYFYDYGAHVNILKKTFETASNKVTKPINDWGTHFLYLGFEEEEVEYEIQEYTMDIFEEIDHQVYGFNLDTLSTDLNIADRDDYTYTLEENDYIFINDYNQIRIKQWTNLPINVELIISIGNVAVKVVKLTVNIKQFNVVCLENEDGSIKADKPYAMTGEPVTIKFVAEEAGFLVQYWIINNRRIEALTSTIVVPMENRGITVDVEGSYLEDAIFIYTVEDFMSIADNLSGTYVQMNDLEFNYLRISPFGSTTTPFTGKYYGNGYEIKNLNVTFHRENDTVYRGLFVHTNGATFHGVTLSNVANVDTCYLNGTSTNYTSINGLLVAQANNTSFLGCQIKNTGISHECFAGSGLFVSRSVSFTSYAGTLAGIVTGNTNINTFGAINVRTYNKVTAGRSLFSRDPIEQNFVGGIIGAASGYLTAEDIYFSGSVVGENAGVGSSHVQVGGVLGATYGSLNAYIEDVLINASISISTKVTHLKGAITGASSSVYGSGWYVSSDKYTVTNSYSDRRTNTFSSAEIYQESFIFDTLGFDAALWTLENGTLLLNDIRVY